MEELKNKLIEHLLGVDLKDKDIFYVKTYVEIICQLDQLSKPDAYERLFKLISNSEYKQKESDSKEEAQNG